MRQDDATVIIHEDGYVTAETLGAARRLADRAGRWRLIPTPPRLMLLQREAQPGAESGRIALAGDIESCGGLLDVINLIRNSSWTGALSTSHRGTRRTIFFRLGEVRAASSNLPEDRLGQILYRFGVITREQLEDALARTGPSSRMGQVLVSMNALTTPALYRWVTRQVEEIFFALLLTRSGEFYFERDGQEPRGANLALSTQALLLEGCRRMDELSYFRQKLTSLAVVLRRREGVTAPSDLTKPQLDLLALVDGHRSLGDLGRLSHLGEFDATHSAFGLLQAGLVEVLDSSTRQPGAAGATSSDFRQLIEAVNWLLVSAHEAIAARGASDADRYRDDLFTYLQSLKAFEGLFENVHCEPDGTMPVDQLIERVSRLRVDDPLLLLLKGLDEVVRFAIFTADLAPDAEQQLRTRIGQVVQQSRRPAEAVPSRAQPPAEA